MVVPSGFKVKPEYAFIERIVGDNDPDSFRDYIAKAIAEVDDARPTAKSKAWKRGKTVTANIDVRPFNASEWQAYRDT